MEGKQYNVSQRISIDAPPEYKAHAVEAARRKASNELYNILYTYKLPAVVDIEEISYPSSPSSEVRPYFDMFRRESEFRIVMTVNPVQFRHIEMAVVPSLEYLPLQGPYSQNLIKRTIQRFGVWLTRIAK